MDSRAPPAGGWEQEGDKGQREGWREIKVDGDQTKTVRKNAFSPSGRFKPGAVWDVRWPEAKRERLQCAFPPAGVAIREGKSQEPSPWRRQQGAA